jgi:hypothetical protein
VRGLEGILVAMELFYRPHHRNAARGVIGDIGLNFKRPKKNRQSESTRPAVGGLGNRAQFHPIADIFYIWSIIT